MRAPATAALLAALALAGCGGDGLARSGDEPAEAPAPAPTEGLTDEQVAEIETALVDAEALLSSIEAEFAQDE